MITCTHPAVSNVFVLQLSFQRHTHVYENVLGRRPDQKYDARNSTQTLQISWRGSDLGVLWCRLPLLVGVLRCCQCRRCDGLALGVLNCWWSYASPGEPFTGVCCICIMPSGHVFMLSAKVSTSSLMMPAWPASTCALWVAWQDSSISNWKKQCL